MPHEASDPAPRLESDRLLLRGHRLEDFEDCLAMWSDPEVTRYVGGEPLSGEEVWARLQRYAGHWSLFGFGFWLVAEKTSGQFLGEVGFADARRQIAPSFEGIPEIGWAFARWAWGRGYAEEAVRTALAWGERHFPPGQETGCLINPDHQASIRLAEKCGYRLFCRTFYKDQPALIYRR